MYQVPIYLPILIFSASVCHSLISFLHYRHTVRILFTDTAYAKAYLPLRTTHAYAVFPEVHTVRTLRTILRRRPIVASDTVVE